MGFKTKKSRYYIVREDYADKDCNIVNKRIKKEISLNEVVALNNILTLVMGEFCMTPELIALEYAVKGVLYGKK